MTLTAPPPGLLAQAELFDQGAIALEVLALEVGQKAPAAAHEHQQATARVVVFALLAQVLGEMVDALGQQRHLDLRGARITLAGAELPRDLALALGRYRCHRPGHASRPSERRLPQSGQATGRCPATTSRVRSTSRCICATRSSG